MFPYVIQPNIAIGKRARKVWLFVVSLAVLVTGGGVSPLPAQATIPKYINFQAKLTNVSNGTNVANGSYTVEFKIYDAVTSGSLLWTESWDGSPSECPQLTVTNGVFNAKLGECNSLSSVDFTTGSLFLSVNFNADGEMSPRKQLVAAPFAFVSNGVNGDGTINILNTGSNQLTVGYDSSNKFTANVTSAGAVTFDASGGSAGFTFSDLITGNLGATVSGATINLNASSNFNTNINTGSSTGAVAIGNNSAGAISLAGSTLSLTSNGAGNDITLNSADTIELQDNTNITGVGTISSILQVGSATAAAYSRFGTGTTGHSLDAANDVLVTDDFEVDGDAFFDGNVTITGTCTGCGASSLQGSYNGGGSITTADNKDFDIVLANTSTDSNLDIDLEAGNTVTISRLSNAITDVPAQLLLLENLDTDLTVTDGLLITSAGSGRLTDAVDASDADIDNALNAGPNNIAITTGTIGSNGATVLDFAEFDVSGSTGGITINDDGNTGSIIIESTVLDINSLDFTGAGAITVAGALTVGSTGQTNTLQGSVTTITSNGAGNDIVLNSADTIELQDNTNVTGNLDVTGTIQAGSGNITLTDATGNIQAGSYAAASIDGDDIASSLAGAGLVLTAGSPDVLDIGAGNGITVNANDVALNLNYNPTWTADHTWTLSAAEDLAVTHDLAGSVSVFNITATPSGSAGTTNGISISQADSANSNGLDRGVLIDNVDTNLAITDGIKFTNTGGGGYTNFLETPSIDISGAGAITGATGYNGLVITPNTGVVTTGTWNGTAVTDTYVADTLTVDSSSSVHWNALNNYPTACSAGSAISTLADSPTCTSFNTDTTITLQDAYNATSGNTITTTTGRNISFVLGEVASPTSLTLENQDTAGTSAQRIFSSIASGTLTNGLLIEQTGAGTMTNALQIAETSGTITDGILITGTLGNILNSPTIDITGGGAITGAQGVSTTTVTASSAIAANGGITFDASTDTVGAFTAAGTIDMNANLIVNIGNSGTDFTSGGGLNVAGTLDSNGDVSIADTNIALDGASSTLTATGALTLTPGGAMVLGATGQAATLQGTTTTITSNGAGNDIVLNSADIISLLPAGFVANVGGGTTSTALRFLEPSGTGTDYAAIQSNANVTTSYTWTLPAADASGCIQSNGSGTLSIAACGGGSSTLQDIYNNDANGSDVVLLMNATDGSVIFQEIAGTNFQITQTTSAPTTDMVAITNSGLGTTTNGVDGISLAFVTGNGSDPTNNGLNIALTSGGTASGDVLNGINLSLSGTSGTERGINIGSGFDSAINIQNAAAGQALVIDASTNALTNTSGVIDLNVDSATNNASGIDLALTTSGTTSSATNFGIKLSLDPGHATNARTVKLLDIDLTGDSGSLADTIYGINIDTSTTTNTSDITTAINLVNNISNFGASAVAGILGTYTLTNTTTDSQFQFGNRFINTISSASGIDSTYVGQFIRMIDDDCSATDCANTTRGMEIQAWSGTNNAGTNTGLAAFAKTFGVYAATSAQAGAVSQPAAVFADLDNSSATTNGNAIRAYTNDATSANMVSVYQETSAYTGTALVINMGNNSGSFSSGNFADFQTAGSTKFKVDYNGEVTLTLDGTASSSAVCGSHSTGSSGDQTSVLLRDCSSAPSADYAEMYPVTEGVEAGDVVALGTKLINTYDQGGDGLVDWTKVKGQIAQLEKSNSAHQANLLGVVSDNYGDFTSAGYNIKKEDNPKSIALAGRVLVKVTNENGQIKAGDYLTSSATELGKAMKATRPGIVIGQALADDTGTGIVMVYVNTAYHDPTVKIGDNGNILLQRGGASTEVITETTDTSAYIIKQNGSGNILQLQDKDTDRFLIENNGVTNITANVASGYVLTVTNNDKALFTINASGDARIYGSLVLEKDLVVMGRVLGTTALLARNASEKTIKQGDLVALLGASSEVFGDNPILDVIPANSNSKKVLVGIADKNFGSLSSESEVQGQESEIKPGEYMSVVTNGTFKKINIIPSSGIEAGDKLTWSSVDGLVKKLSSGKKQLVGVALENAKSESESVKVLLMGFALPAVENDEDVSPESLSSSTSVSSGSASSNSEIEVVSGDSQEGEDLPETPSTEAVIEEGTDKSAEVEHATELVPPVPDTHASPVETAAPALVPTSDPEPGNS